MKLSTPQKMGLLATLYFSQGLPFGFFTQALPVLLREQKASLTAIGFTSLLAMPWVLKFLWAPLVDRSGSTRHGRRRSWIIPLQLCSAVLMVGVAQLDGTNQLPLVLIAVFAANLFAATQDIATDGLAVSLLNHRERGLGNGVQVAGYRVGMILGGGVLLILFKRLGWSTTFTIMGGAILLASIPIALYRETPAKVPDTAPLHWSRMFSELLQRPGMSTWLGLLVLFKFGESMGGGMVRPMLVDLGLDLEGIGWMYGMAGFLASIVGALAGGWLVGVLGRRRALVGFSLLQATGVLVWFWPALGHNDLPTLYAATVYDHVVGSMATAALFTAMMDACDPEQGGTDYTLQASVVAGATGAGAALSGVSADLMGYPTHFVFATALTLLGTFAVAQWYQPTTESTVPT